MNTQMTEKYKPTEEDEILIASFSEIFKKVPTEREVLSLHRKSYLHKNKFFLTVNKYCKSQPFNVYDPESIDVRSMRTDGVFIKYCIGGAALPDEELISFSSEDLPFEDLLKVLNHANSKASKEANVSV